MHDRRARISNKRRSKTDVEVRGCGRGTSAEGRGDSRLQISRPSIARVSSLTWGCRHAARVLRVIEDVKIKRIHRERHGAGLSTGQVLHEKALPDHELDAAIIGSEGD